MTKKERPLGVTILAIWLIIGTILSVILYYFNFFKTVNLFITVILSIILNLIGLIIAYGLFRGLTWAWASAIILIVFGIIFTFINIFFQLEIVIYFIGFRVFTIIDIIILFYLTKPHVKAFFRKI